MNKLNKKVFGIDIREDRFRRRMISRETLKKLFESYGLEVSQDD